MEIKSQIPEKVFRCPNSILSNLLMEILDFGKEIAEMPEIKKKTNHGMTIEIFKEKNSVELLTPSAHLAVKVNDIEKIQARGSYSLKKILMLILMKVCEITMLDGALQKDYVSFPLEELVSKKVYSSKESARKGVEKCLDILLDIHVVGTIKQGRGKIHIIRQDNENKWVPLFTRFEKKGGLYKVCLNNDINWLALTQPYTFLPEYYFALRGKASDLLYYIAYLARQNSKSIAEDSCFFIKMSTVQHKLRLREIEGCKEISKIIVNPILEAMKEIECEHERSLGEKGISLSLVNCEPSIKRDVMENGRLKVSLSGEYLKFFTAFHRKKKAPKKRFSQ